jgi:hypothetical protein
MRGQQSLFEGFFTTDNEQPVMNARQGRSEELHNKRNEALVERYYFYGKFTDKRYEAIVDQLSEEFYIAPFTIQERINENFSKMSELKAMQPTKDYFKKKYPHLVW